MKQLAAKPPGIPIELVAYTLEEPPFFRPSNMGSAVHARSLSKANVDVRFLDIGDVQKMGGDKVKRVIKVRNGIETEVAKKIQRMIKDSKLKVQAAIQEEKVRVTGAKRDDLQAAMALIKKEMTDLPLTFDNFRD